MTRKGNSSISSPLRSFCLKLKRLQEASGLTQTALAKHVGLSKSQMSAILNGSITRLPDQDLIGIVVRKCMEHAAKSHRSLPIDLRREEDWKRRYNDLESDLEMVPRAPAKQGRHRLSLSDRDRTGEPLKAKQFVVGEIPREPPSFVVREALGQLAEIVGRRRVAVVCTMTGLRGVGKSQIAAAYARDRVSKGWALVGWVNAESRDALLWGLAQVAEQLGVADPGGDSLTSAQLLREHLNARTSQGLLVFDNATDPDVLRPFLPATGGTQVVITTTDQAFTEFGEGLDVPTFSRSESLRFLAARTSLNDEAGASEIARELGDHPLGLA